jgi:cysteine desulfurase/selenocysteine lyase
MNAVKIREDFPALKNNPRLVYFDNACMPLRPKQVIDKLNEYYNEYPACAGRSMHGLGKKVTDEVEDARNIIKKFIGCPRNGEIVFTKNATEAINLVAYSLQPKKVMTTDKEHNSNLLPWQRFAHLTLKSNTDNTFNLEEFEKVLKKEKPDLIAMVHTSNLDGYTIPAKEIIKIAHKNGSLVLLDGAQSVPHKEIDVGSLDVDFLAFSGHKMLGPTGIGCLYAKKELLEKMKPFMLGGETVIDSTYDSYTKETIINRRFEAGLQHYAGIIGLGEAARYLMKIGRANIEKHEITLNKRLTEGLKDVVQIIGPKDPELRGGIFSFIIPGLDHHEAAIMLDQGHNIAVRSGAHCVHSWFNAHNIQGCIRASLYLYNTQEEIDKFIEAVKELKKLAK